MSTLIPYNYCKVKFYVNIIVFSSCTTPNVLLMRFILKITLTTPNFFLIKYAPKNRQFLTDLCKQSSTIKIVAKYDNNINLLKFPMNFF